MPPLTAFNTTAYTNKDKAKISAKTYAEQFPPNLCLADPAQISHVTDIVENFLMFLLSNLFLKFNLLLYL